MTISLSKNVPSLMAMTLGMVSMIIPADARTPIYAQSILSTSGDRLYTCNTDGNKNPYPDCLNILAVLCNTTDPTWSSDPTKKTRCHNAVDQMFGQMNDDWQNVRKACGQWLFTQNGTSYAGFYPSTKCASANDELIAKGYYVLPGGVKVRVTRSFTDLMNVAIWWIEKNICGKTAAVKPPATYPSPSTPTACLAIGPEDLTAPNRTLVKRAEIFSMPIGNHKFTCNIDGNKNPHGDCLNSMAAFCSFDKAGCHDAVDQMFRQMSDDWQNVRKECGRWPFTQNGISYTGNYLSDKCNLANANLMANAFYIQDGVPVSVPLGLTESVKAGLWSQVTA